MGKDSIHVRFKRLRLKIVIASASEPGRWAIWNMTAVLSRPERGRLGADHGEARNVVGIVLDPLGQQVEPIMRRGFATGYRRRARLLSRDLHGGRRAGDLDRAGPRQMPGQPVAALRKWLCLAVDLDDFATRAAAHQGVPNAQLHFAADFHAQPGERIERVGDPAVGRIFDRHQPVISLPTIHFLEYRRDRADRHQLDALTKAVQRGQMAIGVERAEKGDAKLLGQLPRAAENLAKNRSDAVRRQGPSTGREQVFDRRIVASREERLRSVLLGPLSFQLGE